MYLKEKIGINIFKHEYTLRGALKKCGKQNKYEYLITDTHREKAP